MRLSSVPYSTNINLLQCNQSVPCNRLLADTKLVQQNSPGHIIYTPIVQKIKKNIENIALANAEKYGFNEMLFPVLMRTKLLDISGKTQEYADEFYAPSDPKGNLLIAPTTEERLIDFVACSGTLSYKSLPLRFSQASNVYRNLKRTEGLYKSREISSITLTAIDIDREMFLQTINDFILLCEESFKQMGIPNFYVQDKVSGAVEFFYTTELADRPLSKSIINNFGIKKEFENQEKFGSLSMGYQFNQSEKFNLFYTNNTGVRKKPVVSTYGIGTQRCIHTLFEQAKNGRIDAFSPAVRPFDVDIIVLSKDTQNVQIKMLAEQLQNNKIPYCIDDRNNSMKDKMRFSEFFSVPCRIIIGDKEIAQQQYSVKPLTANGPMMYVDITKAIDLVKQLTTERVR